jgi:hypothetical protein
MQPALSERKAPKMTARETQLEAAPRANAELRVQAERVAVKSFPSKTVRKNYQRIEAQKQPFSELLVVSQFEN